MGDEFAHRRASATITVTDALGVPLPHREVTVRQTRHEMRFGNILFDLVGWANGTPDDELDDAEAAAWLDLFNFGTLPFYWRGFEPAPGRPDTGRLLGAARRFRELGVELKGHPLTWHTLAPGWLLGRPLDDVERLLRARIAREVTSFAGVIDTWDAINELVIMPVFAAEDNAVTPLCRAKGRIEMARLAFQTARDANPHVTLLLNDFDLTSAYECLIEGLLAAGVRIDAIGLQTHMHQGYRGDDAVWALLERFARFGLPLHMTETSLVSGHLMPPEIVDLNDYRVAHWPSTLDGEARQASQIASYYRTLVAHPAVQAITYWGLTDRTAWLGAPSGLLRADGTKKPAYEALRSLIKGEWWLEPTKMVTDENGHIEVTGFKGVYEVQDGKTTQAFTL